MILGQRDYPQELGTGAGYSITQFGCALVSVTSILINVFGITITVLELNQKLIAINGFSNNGVAGVFDILDWTAITKLFPQITLAFNRKYYNPPDGQGLPADMTLIDGQLSQGLSVIVGVSFNHNTKEPQPTHYVEIYKKNSDGTYQCRDPWFKDDVIFDDRYAVNGMSVPQCILQAVSYNGPVLSQAVAAQTPVSTDATQPESTKSISITLTIPASESVDDYMGIKKSDFLAMHKKCDTFDVMDAAGYHTLTDIDQKVQDLNATINEQSQSNLQLKREVEDTTNEMQGILLNYQKRCETDSKAINDGIKAQSQLSDLQKDHQVIAQAAGTTKTDTFSLLNAIDKLRLFKDKFLTMQKQNPQLDKDIHEVEVGGWQFIAKTLGLSGWVIAIGLVLYYYGIFNHLAVFAQMLK